MTHRSFLRQLRAAIAEAGNQASLAERCAVNASLISLVVNGRLDPPPKLLSALGYVRVVSYKKVPPC